MVKFLVFIFLLFIYNLHLDNPNRLYKQKIDYIWRFGELHTHKLVVFITVMVSVFNVKINILL